MKERKKKHSSFSHHLVSSHVLSPLMFLSQSQDAIRHDRNAVHHGMRSFYKPYSSAGLMGVTVRGPATPNEAFQESVVDALQILPAGKTTKNDVAKATQRAAISFYHDNVENQRDYISQIATSAFSAEEILESINAITADDCNAAFTAMKNAKPVAFSTGKTHDIPALRKMVADLKL